MTSARFPVTVPDVELSSLLIGDHDTRLLVDCNLAALPGGLEECIGPAGDQNQTPPPARRATLGVCAFAQYGDFVEEPPLVEVEPGHLARCFHT